MNEISIRGSFLLLQLRKKIDELFNRFLWRRARDLNYKRSLPKHVPKHRAYSFLSFKMSRCSTPSKCSFAADRLALLESAAAQYAKLRAATIAAGASGALDRAVVSDDLAVLDKKLRVAVAKMTVLKPCLR